VVLCLHELRNNKSAKHKEIKEMAKRKNNDMMTIEKYEKITGRKYEPAESMTLDEYKLLYKMALKLSFDAENFGLFEMIIDRDIQKAKLIQAIIKVMNDVPRGRMMHIMDYKNVEYDPDEIYEMVYED
jgi:hypothetical protein